MAARVCMQKHQSPLPLQRGAAFPLTAIAADVGEMLCRTCICHLDYAIRETKARLQCPFFLSYCCPRATKQGGGVSRLLLSSSLLYSSAD